jgi:hypothetical protein
VVVDNLLEMEKSIKGTNFYLDGDGKQVLTWDNGKKRS